MAADACDDDGCPEAVIAAIDAADPDLDPIWSLMTADALVGDISGHSHRSVEISHVEQRVPAFAAQEEVVEVREEGHEEKADHVPLAGTRRPPMSAVVDKPEVSPCCFILPSVEEGLTPPQPKRWDVNGCDGFVIDGVLSERECNELIAQADGLWSFWDSSEKPRVTFRNADTIEVTHPELAAQIWDRVSPFVGPVTFEEDDERFEIDIGGAWHPYAINDTLLFGRYLKGGHFSPHTDGTTVIDFNRRTFYSCILFLNASPWGGHTRLYSDDQIGRQLVKDDEGRLTGDPASILDAVAPMPGRMLVFYHRIMHEGVPAAEKYIIRTDVLYHREPELCTAPEDAEAFELYQEAQLVAERGDCDGALKLFRRAFRLSPALCKVYKM